MTPMAVSQVSNDGQVLRRNLILIDGSVSGGIRLDLEGNIYIGARIKPKDRPVPGFINEDSLTGSYDTRVTQKWWADEMYGSILKFPNTGGSVRCTDVSPYTVNPATDTVLGGGAGHGNYPARAEGVLWMHYGLSHLLVHSNPRSKCWCYVTRFDVDKYGRIFYPNTFQYEFRAMDNSRNQMFRVKNRDVPQVAIGFGHHIEVTDRALYIADHYNNQVVSFVLTADLESVTDLPAYIENNTLVDLNKKVVISNFPNPFTPSTKISVNFKFQATPGRLDIFDMSGRQIKTLSTKVMPGMAVTWDGRDDSDRSVCSGFYVCRLTLGDRVINHKILLLK
jgi:hypothetical protein